MRTTISFLYLFFSIVLLVYPDTCVKGLLNIDGGYRYAYNIPEINVVNEWYFGESKVKFSSKGWFLEFMPMDWSFKRNRLGRCPSTILPYHELHGSTS